MAKPQVDTSFLNQEFSPEVQLQFGRKLLKHLGFSTKNSRLDISTHPFCTGLHPLDTRMTTRTHTDDVMSSIFSVLHEGGHAMYNQGLPVEWAGTPLGEAISLGIDESQSRWWETCIGRSRSFWSFCLPLLQKDFPQLKNTALEPFYKAINKVTPSFIRVEADEVTYNLHIILRFEIEKGLIEGSLKVKEIPEVWNQKMQELLGITPKTNTEGCLQDIHWAMGSLGYFPTYALGNLFAAQFFAVFEKAHPDWTHRVEKGDFAFIREWLRREIHQFGRQYTPNELVQKVTGKDLDESAYLAYLDRKYGAIYG
jgi:carboxypeptidase Taq